MNLFHAIAISVTTESSDHYLELIFFRDIDEFVHDLDQCAWVREPIARYEVVLRDSGMNDNPRLQSTCKDILKYRLNLL